MDPSFQKAKGWVWQEKIVGEEHAQSYSIEEFWFHKPLVYWSSPWFKPKKPNFHTRFLKPPNNLNQFWNIKISEENSCIGSGQHD